MELLSFQALKKNLRKDFNAFKLIKLAILGDSATQMYVQAVKGYGYEVGLNFEIFEADYDQIERQIYDPTSVLYEFKPEYIIIFYCTNKLLKRFGKLSLSEKPDFGQDIKDKAENLYQTIINRLKCKVVYVNYPEINDAVFGNYGNKTNISFIYQVRRINFELMTLSQKLNSLYILDVNALQSQYGQSFITDQKIYINTDLFPSIDFLPVMAKNTIDIIQSISGKFKKCIILDLDNTIWGGIIGGGWIESLEVELTKVTVQLLNIILISLVLNYNSQVKIFTS